MEISVHMNIAKYVCKNNNSYIYKKQVLTHVLFCVYYFNMFIYVLL